MTANPNKHDTKSSELTNEEMRKRNAILKRMEENGDYNRIKHDLYAKLILNDAWRETMYQRTREAVHLRGGVPEITLGDLSRALIQTGSNAVPESVKKETMQQIQKASNNDI